MTKENICEEKMDVFPLEPIPKTCGVGKMSVSTDGSFYGDSHLKVDVHRKKCSGTVVPYYEVNFSCSHALVEGDTYTVSFYGKGKVGNELSLSLVDDEEDNIITEIESNTQEIRLDEWTYYTASFTKNTPRQDLVQIKFLNPGIYEIAELVLKVGEYRTWYVSGSGTDSLSDGNGLSKSHPLKTIAYAVNEAWKSGDVVYVMGGVYRNNGYGSGELDNKVVVEIEKTGTLHGPLVIRNAPGDKPIIEFDGFGGFHISHATYLEIAGFEIRGPSEKITKAEAEAARIVNRKNYFIGKGINIMGEGGHHICLHSNLVHDCPACGLRMDNSDYCIISKNEVYNCTFWTPTGESAIVIAQSKSYDTQLKIKMRITKNKVYNNQNFIHFYNPRRAAKDGPECYGCANFPKIVDGQGCYITRNNDNGSGEFGQNPNGQYIGCFYFANNVAYGNGINGLVVHKSDNSIVMNNTVYNNGATPLSSGRQNAGGITINNSVNVRLYNNISVVRHKSDFCYQAFGHVDNIEGKNNLQFHGGPIKINGLENMVHGDPLFKDASSYDLRLSPESKCIHAGVEASEITVLTGNENDHSYLPEYDILNKSRHHKKNVNIGAY